MYMNNVLAEQLGLENEINTVKIVTIKSPISHVLYAIESCELSNDKLKHHHEIRELRGNHLVTSSRRVKNVSEQESLTLETLCFYHIIPGSTIIGFVMKFFEELRCLKKQQPVSIIIKNLPHK